MNKHLTRKERKRLAKGKLCIKQFKNVKVREVKTSLVTRLKPFNVNNNLNIDDDLCLDFIAASRRDQYTKGYMKGMRY